MPSSAYLRASPLASSPQPYAKQHHTQILTERKTNEKQLVLPQLRAADGSATPRGQSHRPYHMDNRCLNPKHFHTRGYMNAAIAEIQLEKLLHQ